MRYCSIVISFLVVSLLMAFTEAANAARAGFCNDKHHTPYICCPGKGGWIVNSAECGSGTEYYCKKNTGIVANSNPQVTILADCKNKGGSFVMYLF